MNVPGHIDFRAASRHVPPRIPAAVQRATGGLIERRAAAVALVPEWESLRHTAHDVRLDGILHLDEYVEQAENAIRAAGGHVHRARDAAEANAIVVDIARKHGVKTVVKGKSMATEEIGLNQALEQAGIRPVETDVGEFIIQLAGERPSHILGPTLHMTKEEIAELFSRTLGVNASPNPVHLTQIARAQLRQEFLRAEMGITGANFVVAETGTVVLLTNEGNGRLCTTLPDLHVAIAGIDKIIPDWNALDVLLRLLARNATGQKMACHTSFITGPRRAAAENGPREFHLVLLDNGRSRIRQDPVARETLLCIRCAMCLNVCPVYNQVGGHAYGWVYSGAIGAILSPQLLGMQVARDLPFASTLCGACADICPVKIPIPQILLHLRRRVVEGDPVERATAPTATRVGGKLVAATVNAPWLYELGSQLVKLAQRPMRRGDWLPALPSPLSRWTQARPLPAFDARFHRWWKHRSAALSEDNEGNQRHAAPMPDPTPIGRDENRNPVPGSEADSPDDIDALLAEISRLSGKAYRLREQAIDRALKEMVEREQIKTAVIGGVEDLAGLNLAARLRAFGVKIVSPQADKATLGQTDLGITAIDFALADSGSLGLLSSPDQPRMISILPRVHLAIIRRSALRPSLTQLLIEARHERYLVLITGVSRTSDIESNPVLGAHGPQALYVWALV